MIYIGIAILVVGLFLGRLWGRHGPRLAARGPWRPGAALLALVALLAALVCGLREAWGPSGLLLALALYLMLQARRHEPEPRRAGPLGPPPKAGVMGRGQAASILGVRPEAPRAEVQAAYLRLMRVLHPDSGGTSGLAAQLNEARETLLRPAPPRRP